MFLPKISVIMPCFNDGKYIEKSIESVIRQDISEWELIIVDDGSDDPQTLTVLNRLREHDRIHIIHGKHCGVSSARNTGIAAATGKYILPLDSNVIFVTSMFRKSDWIKVNGFDEAMVYGLEDYEFWLSILELKRKVYRIPEILFFYRIKKVSRNQMFLESDLQKHIQTYDYISRKHYRLYAEYASEIIPLFRKRMIEREEKINRLKRKIPFYNFFKDIILKYC